MSNKERVIQLLENVPDNKLIFVVNILESMKAYANEPIEPDEWDLQMIEQARQINHGETVTFDQALNECGLTYDDLRD